MSQLADDITAVLSESGHREHMEACKQCKRIITAALTMEKALERISSGTTDLGPPYRYAPARDMLEVARETLKKVRGE